MATRPRSPHGPVIIEAALNGGRRRAEHPGVPCTPAEVAAEAALAAAAGAAVVHIHARSGDGWSSSPAWYADAITRIRDGASGEPPLVSLTSLRPPGAPVGTITSLLDVLSRNDATCPDLISVNLGHIVRWEPPAPLAPIPPSRISTHFQNDHDDIASLLLVCRASGVTPELGIMDLGFVSNAVALRAEAILPESPWFLVELDSPAYGAGVQVASSTVEDYGVLVSRLRAHFPAARFAAHGAGRPGYDVLRRALAEGAHVRVGFEDAIHLPDGTVAAGNAALVTWAVDAAAKIGRSPATVVQARAIIAGE